MNVRVLAALGLTGLIVALVAILGMGETEDEEAVRATLMTLVDAVERHDEDALMEHVAIDYGDRLGHSYETIGRRVVNEMRVWDELTVTLESLDLEVNEDTGYATVAFRPGFEGVRNDAPDVRESYQGPEGRKFRVTFRKHGDRWLVTRGDVTFSLSDAL